MLRIFGWMVGSSPTMMTERWHFISGVILGLDPRIQSFSNQPMAAWVYIVASGRNGTLYIGVTIDIARRAYEHKKGLVKGFASVHKCTDLVWLEAHDTMPLAIQREKNLKRYLRKWKLELIEHDNPGWRDLYEDLNK